MSLPRAIAALTASHDAGTWASTGTGLPIYIGEQPTAVRDCITLYIEPDGIMPDPDEPDDRLGRTCDARYVIRHGATSLGKTAPGQAAAQRIIDQLHGVHDATVTDTRTSTIVHVTQILARTSVPTPLGPDPDGTHEWTVVLSIDYDTEEQ